MPEWAVPGYTELKTLGSGGFGDVVLARHDATGTKVAIKYLRRELLADPGFTAMFRGEAAVLASLEDPNVVRLYEYAESPAGAGIVMELVNGVSLHEILAHQGSTAPEAALVVLQGSLLGLAAAHQRGVVHRDYKPANVLVSGDGVSKLTDFGIAARTGDRPVPAGTLHYMAPEQIDGAPASPAGDVYSATATFYECLVGRPPFTGESAELLRQHRAEPVPLDPVPASLRPLVTAGMAKDPQRRPANAMAFVGELRNAAPAAYGKDWEKRGRSHLGEAALLLAALWPSGAPSAAQGTAVHRIRLLRHAAPAKAAIAAGAAVVVVAAGTALAASQSHGTHLSNQQAAAIHPVSLQPTPTSFGPLSSTPGSISPRSISPTQTSGSPSSGPPTSGPPTSGPPTSGPPTSGLPSSGPPSSGPPSSGPPSSGPPSSGPPTSDPPTSTPPTPFATTCEPDGTGCTKGGTYADPNALISSNYTGFKVTWTSATVQPYSSGVPLYWTVGMTYTNIESSALTLGCPGDWANASNVAEYMSGGKGNDGMVAAGSTTCSENPDWTDTVAPGDSVEIYATFHNVPWPGVAVAIQWGSAGTSASIYPFT